MVSFDAVTATAGKLREESFRIALGLGQDVESALSRGIVYQIGEQKATNMLELQQMYNDVGSAEMYVRIATKRYNNGDVYHARIHNLEVSLEYCRIAASLNHPINPEITQPDKEWSEYTLKEMCSVLEQYGEFVAREILETGYTVEYWNLGNEADFGFAGANLGLKTAVNPELEHVDAECINMGHADTQHKDADYLKENLWKYNGQMMAALVENGIDLNHVGISIYPTNALALHLPDYMDRLKSVIKAMVSECELPVFIAEYGYPSKELEGGFVWNQQIEGYELTIADQARVTVDFIAWCKENGVNGIRPWAPDLLGDWEAMSLFSYDDATRIATAKPVIGAFK